ncbi:MAG: hypothetical protein KGJ07_07650 [Patescibacteria group bacterium]|nr:hypothetical protein [Patescibacteria group bacterium]MDE2591030.1 hypothetical protein [Patescibacteria group bacterium]
MRRIVFNTIAILFSVIVFSGISYLYHSVESVITKEFILTANDNGEIATYPVGALITIILDRSVFPQNNWQIVCSRAHILQKVGTSFFLLPPLYGEKYITKESGTCWVKNNSFSVTVHFIDFPS